MKQANIGYTLLIFAFVGLATQVLIKRANSAEESEEFLPTNVSLVITLISSILAVALFVVSLFAYRTDRRTRFVFVMAAFFLFAVKGVLIALADLNELGLLVGFLGDFIIPFYVILTPISRLLDFGILILFFFGMLKK